MARVTPAAVGSCQAETVLQQLQQLRSSSGAVQEQFNTAATAGRQQPSHVQLPAPVRPQQQALEMACPDAGQQQQQEPLLAQQQEHGQQQARSSTFLPCMVALAKVIIGAGMMSIPSALERIGALAAVAMLIGVGLLTYYTLAVLVHASATTGAATYAQLTRSLCGRRVAQLLQASILAFCVGFCVVYLVVIRDILRGTPPACNGLMCELLGPGWSLGGLLADGRVMVVAVALLLCAPLLLIRSLELLAPLNAVGVAAIALLAAVAAGLAVQGLVRGSAFALPLLPQWQLLGPTPGAQLQALTAVLPVLIACYVAHQSVHPLMPLLRPYNSDRMCRVAAGAVGIACLVFTTLALGAALTFGPALDVNVLNNFSVAGLQPLVGGVAARALSWGIRGGYLLSLLASLLLYVHPLRACLAELLWGDDDSTAQQPQQQQQQQQQQQACAEEDGEAAVSSGGASTQSSPPLPRWQQLEAQRYLALTYGLLAAMTVVAALVPNIWVALSAIGDLASTVQAFIVPGLIALATLRPADASEAAAAAASGGEGDTQQHVCPSAEHETAGLLGDGGRKARQRSTGASLQRGAQAAAGGLLVALGVALFANGVLQRLR